METLPLWLQIFLGLIAIWCFFWWLIGMLVFFLFLGGIALQKPWPFIPVLFPPFSAIALPLFLLLYYCGAWRNKAEKIAKKLKKCGIRVIRTNLHWGDNYLIEAEVKPEQVEYCRSVFEWGVRKFFKKSHQKIWGVKPLEYSNHKWANNIGIEECVAKHFSVLCGDCGKKILEGFWWGSDAEHQGRGPSLTLQWTDGVTQGHGKYCEKCWDRKRNRLDNNQIG